MDGQVDMLMAALEKRKIPCTYVTDRKAAKERLLSMIRDQSTVGIGGSMTIQELDLEAALQEKDCTVFWHWRAQGRENMELARRKAMTADTYLCSTNAITASGILVNIDGTGNRVAAMVHGPKQVVIVVGVNKIVDSVEDALARIKDVACRLNGQRLKLNTPCAVTGKCTDCSSSQRMCNVTTFIEGKPNGVDMHVLLVGESLGY